jgi:beta-lactamase regulating signal transducer with metallopeptidase domain
MMDHLLQASIRSVLIAALAALGLSRAKSASMRHAVWTLVTASMLAQIGLSPLLPEIPLRVLRAVEAIAIPAANQVSPAEGPTPALQVHPVMSWEQVVAVIYFCGLLFFVARLIIALLFARRLVRENEPAGQGSYQSCRISAPLTIGRRILLPMSWREWDANKLRAVLAHEESHVRRHDWAIAVIARVNQCVFWFHPLAWWLERELARLAEQACDDAALELIGNRQQYARTLLDIARAIHNSKGRVLAVSSLSAPMAKEATVETRLNRILDETRRIPQALGRRGWTALTMLAVPLVYMAATIQLAPAQTPAISPQLALPLAPQITIAQAQAPQAPVAQGTPVSPQPPVTDYFAERERKRQARMAALAAVGMIPGGQAAQVRQGDAVADSEQKILELERQLKLLQESRQQQLAREAALQAAAGAMQLPGAGGSPLMLHVNVTSMRLTTISIPLDPTQQFDVIGQIKTEAGESAGDFTEHVDRRAVIEKQVPLKAGKYQLKILVRNPRNRQISTQVTTFEVE